MVVNVRTCSHLCIYCRIMLFGVAKPNLVSSSSHLTLMELCLVGVVWMVRVVWMVSVVSMVRV